MNGRLLIVSALALPLWACSFGDRSVHLTAERPVGVPEIPRGISVVLELPEDRRPEPHDVVGSVRSGVGVKTADITSDDDVREWIQKALLSELQNEGFHVASTDGLGRALRIRTTIHELSCEESIGFGAKMSLEIQVAGDATRLMEKTYRADERHLIVTKTSGRDAADSLRACLRKIVTEFVRDLVTIAERSPD